MSHGIIPIKNTNQEITIKKVLKHGVPLVCAIVAIVAGGLLLGVGTYDLGWGIDYGQLFGGVTLVAAGIVTISAYIFYRVKQKSAKLKALDEKISNNKLGWITLMIIGVLVGGILAGVPVLLTETNTILFSSRVITSTMIAGTTIEFSCGFAALKWFIDASIRDRATAQAKQRAENHKNMDYENDL